MVFYDYKLVKRFLVDPLKITNPTNTTTMNGKAIVQALMHAIFEYYFGIPRGINLPNFSSSNVHNQLREYGYAIKNTKMIAKIQERYYYYQFGANLYELSWNATRRNLYGSSNNVQVDMINYAVYLGYERLMATAATNIWTIFEKRETMLDYLGDIPISHFNRISAHQVMEVKNHLDNTQEEYYQQKYGQQEYEDSDPEMEEEPTGDMSDLDTHAEYD